MDHIMVKIEAVGPKLTDVSGKGEPGRCIYLPRFDQSDRKGATERGYGIQLYQSAAGDRSWFTAVAMGEITPRAENKVTLAPAKRDTSGNAILHIDFRYDQGELLAAERMAEALKELAKLAGAEILSLSGPAIPGTSVHECGTARMGTSPENSVLDARNMSWQVPGLYVTDGAAFPSQGTQNPTLTIMALTARACAHAIS
jgi:choline dehydrogenase-like flavoprotein